MKEFGSRVEADGCDSGVLGKSTVIHCERRPVDEDSAARTETETERLVTRKRTRVDGHICTEEIRHATTSTKESLRAVSNQINACQTYIATHVEQSTARGKETQVGVVGNKVGTIPSAIVRSSMATVAPPT